MTNPFETIGPEAPDGEQDGEQDGERRVPSPEYTPPSPLPQSPLGGLVQEARRSVRERVRQARDFYNQREVREAVRKGERLFKIGKDIQRDNPLTWVHAAFKTAETLYDFDRVSMAPALREFRERKETAHELTQDSVTHLFVSLLDETLIEVVESSPSPDGKRRGPTLYAYPLPLADGEVVQVNWFRDNFEYSELICSSEHDLHRVRRALSAMLWEDKGRQVEMEWSTSREFAFRVKEPPLWKYEGEFGLKLIDRWKRALKLGVRRFVILHGKPGMGKSTLARQLGMEATDKRVLYVPTSVIMAANSINYFMDTLALCAPDIVIIDDIDRMGSKLNALLALFEETETSVPLLLATTNDLHRLPDALKRPGRFDEIWHIKPPPAHVMGRVIRYLASLESLELTDEQVGVVATLAVDSRLSGAHIREMMRRIRLGDVPQGWSTAEDLTFDERDLTFGERWRPSDYTPEGVVVVEDSELVEEDWGDD